MFCGQTVMARVAQVSFCGDWVTCFNKRLECPTEQTQALFSSHTTTLENVNGGRLMAGNNTEQNELTIASFAALKTAIVNGEVQLVAELITKLPMQELEKSYLLDLAKLNNNRAIINLLEHIPIKQ